MPSLSYPQINDQLRYTFGAGAGSLWYIPPTRSTITPPTTTTPGRPAVDPQTIQPQGGGGGCGCGNRCGGGSAVAYPGALPVTLGGVPGTGAALIPEVGTLPGQSLTSPAGSAPSLFGDTSMFANIDWSSDWWKFLAGALVYKLLAK